MLYRKRSFSVSAVTVPSSAPRGTLCAEKGHSGRDAKGRCYSCGERIPEPDINKMPLGIADVLEYDRDPRLEAITTDYLDEPAQRANGPCTSLKTRDEMVNLEGGPAGDISVPGSQLIPSGRLNLLEWNGRTLFYRAIGVPTDSPRIFAFDSEAIEHTVVE